MCHRPKLDYPYWGMVINELVGICRLRIPIMGWMTRPCTMFLSLRTCWSLPHFCQLVNDTSLVDQYEGTALKVFFFRNEISQVTDHPISRIEMIHQHINKHSITVEFPAGILNGTSTSFWGPLNLLPAYGYQSLQAQQHASVAQPHQNFWAPWPAWISCGQVVETLDGTMMPPNVLDWDWCLKISLHKCRQKCARSAGLTCCWALSTRCFEKAPF